MLTNPAHKATPFFARARLLAVETAAALGHLGRTWPGLCTSFVVAVYWPVGYAHPQSDWKGAYAFEQVLLLNASFEPLNVISWKRALKLVVLEKVEVVEESEREVCAVTCSIRVPSVVRLLRFVGFRKRDVKFSRQNIFARDHYRCQYCGQKNRITDLTYDHVIPKSRGGRTEWTNIVTCCISCNRKKGGKTPREAGLKLVRKPGKPSWLLGFQARFTIHRPPPAWLEYLYWITEPIE